jgi:hypothetical protein
MKERGENCMRQRKEPCMRDNGRETLPSCGSSCTSLIKVNVCMNALMYVLRNDIVYESIGSVVYTLESKCFEL